jgi:hypothetical protein
MNEMPSFKTDSGQRWLWSLPGQGKWISELPSVIDNFLIEQNHFYKGYSDFFNPDNFQEDFLNAFVVSLR